MAVEFGKWEKIERKEIVSPILYGVSEISISDLDEGSQNDGTGNLGNYGMLYGKTYKLKVSKFAYDMLPTDKEVIRWHASYLGKENVLTFVGIKRTGKEITFECDDLDFCGREFTFYAYVENRQTQKAELNVFCHNRFRWFDKEILKSEIQKRINTGMNINQGYSSMCGVAVIGHYLAIENPTEYERIILELHKKGKVTVFSTNFEIKIDTDEHLIQMKKTDKKYPKDMSYADFIFLFVIKDYLNIVWDYDPDGSNVGGLVEGGTGLTLPQEIEKMMQKILGYSDIIDETNLLTSKWSSVTTSFADLKSKINNNYNIALLIKSDNFTYNKKSKFSIPSHWVGLKEISIDEKKKTLTLSIFTWGEIESWMVSFDVFKDGYFGYVAGK